MSNRNRKKKGDKNYTLETLVLITAILQLIETLMEIIKKLIE
jgi:hypothetical protein